MKKKVSLPRPKTQPRKIPVWAWHLNAWLDGGKRAPRPKAAPKRIPAWFWLWRSFRLARAKGKGSRAWKKYLKQLQAQPDPQPHVDAARVALVKWAKEGIAHKDEIHYSEGGDRGDFLHERRGSIPRFTDCSGYVTWCYFSAGLPDPSGLGYRFCGYTGTILANAAKHGRILYDVSQAKPGDPIVVGPGTGWHVVICLEAGHDPIVGSNGSEPGPLSELMSYDTRAPKRVCQILN